MPALNAILFNVTRILFFSAAYAQPEENKVPDDVMERVYNEIKTPYKYGLVHLTDWEGEDLIAPTEPYDELFAHKSFVVKQNDVVYHFYCAVNKQEDRGIAVATSVG